MNRHLQEDERIGGGLKLLLFAALVLTVIGGGGILYGLMAGIAAWLQG